MVHSRRVTVARARPRTSSSRAKLSMSARRTANRGRERARHQVVNWRRSSAYASRVSPRYPARNPARASRSGSVKAGWIVTSAVDGAAVVIGHLPAGLEPGRLGQFRPQRLKRKPTVSRPARSRYATSGRVSGVGIPPEKCSRPIRRGLFAMPVAWRWHADCHFWAADRLRLLRETGGRVVLAGSAGGLVPCGCLCGQSGAGGDAELGEDVGQVHLDGAGGDEQPPGDGVVPQALADEADDLQFGGGQAGPAGSRAFASAALARRVGHRVVEGEPLAFFPCMGETVFAEGLPGLAGGAGGGAPDGGESR